jgi:spore coat protein CotH
MRYFAVGTLLNYGETSLFNGIADDYALYRGTKDRRFVLIGHDYDTILGQGDTGASYYPINTNSSIYVMLNPPNPNANSVPVLRRFMTNANFAHCSMVS